VYITGRRLKGIILGSAGGVVKRKILERENETGIVSRPGVNRYI
jgi:hypothetical protein